MTRRPAPSALLLRKGPTPGRGQPKHSIPAPPPPTFVCPTMSRARPVLQLMVDDITGIPVAPNANSPTSSPCSTTNLLPQWEAPSYSPSAPNASGSYASDKVIPPWDRTRTFSFDSQNSFVHIQPLKPVVPNPVPMWAW